MIPMLADHLWQSTVFAIAAGLLTLAFRRNHAAVRFWLWFAASVKFLIPFAALVTIAGRFAWRSPATASGPTVAGAIDAISQPFSLADLSAVSNPAPAGTSSSLLIPIVLLGVWLAGSLLVVFAWWVRWRRVAAAVRQGSPMTQGRELDALRRLEQRVGIDAMPLISSIASLEPGVFGIWKPVVLWPRQMTERLNDMQIDAIMAHEVCHVRRRDNLLASLHMFVEAAFWFHPLVWWVGAQLLRERERACDEDVVTLGSEPRIYAESILKTCEFCLESPLASVSGVTGGNLRNRIEQIMANVAGANLSASRKLFLVVAALAAILGPVGAAVLNGPRLLAQTSLAAVLTEKPDLMFEVASVKPNRSGASGSQSRNTGGQFEAINMSLTRLIQMAYDGLPDFQISGGAAWLSSDRFDIVAKAPENALDPGNPRRQGQQIQQMLRALLLERFKLAVHTETRDLPVYELVMARADRRFGPQLQKTPGCATPGDCAFGVSGGLTAPARGGGGGMSVGAGAGAGGGYSNSLKSRGAIAALAASLTRSLGRVVLDRTTLAGDFDIELKWNAESPTIFTALQEQLGLKLQSAKGPVEILVIDSAEKPTEN